MILNEDTPAMYVKYFIRDVINGEMSSADFNNKRINAEKSNQILSLKDGHNCQTREAGKFTLEAMEIAKKSNLTDRQLRMINQALTDYVTSKVNAIRNSIFKRASVVSEESYFNY